MENITYWNMWPELCSLGVETLLFLLLGAIPQKDWRTVLFKGRHATLVSKYWSGVFIPSPRSPCVAPSHHRHLAVTRAVRAALPPDVGTRLWCHRTITPLWKKLSWLPRTHGIKWSLLKPDVQGHNNLATDHCCLFSPSRMLPQLDLNLNEWLFMASLTQTFPNLTSIKVATLKQINKNRNNKYWLGRGNFGTLVSCWLKCKRAQELWKTVRQFLWKFKIELSYNWVISFLGLNPKELKPRFQRDVCISTFIAALFMITKTWKASHP